MAVDTNLLDELSQNKRVLPPSPYGTSLEAIARKRAIAKALMEGGLHGPPADSRSYAQLLGSLAQAWAGKSIDRDLDKQSEGIQQQQMAEYQPYAASRQHIAQALAGGTDPTAEDLASVTGSRFADPKDVLVESLLHRADHRSDLKDEGEIKPVLGEDGNQHPARFSKDGNYQLTDGYTGKITMADPAGFDLGPGGQQFSKSFGQATGRVFIDPNKPTIAPDGRHPVRNEPAISALSEIAAAGRPVTQVDSKVQVNNADEAAKGAFTILENSHAAAMGAAQAYDTLRQLKQVVTNGNFVWGPGTSLTLGLRRLFGNDNTKVAQTRQAVQGLAQLVLNNRGQLKGQGSVSDNEGKLLERATSDQIESMSPAEIREVISITERKSQWLLNNHQRLMDASQGIQGIDQYRPMFEVPNPWGKPPAQSGGGKPSLQDRARQIYERRYGKGGSGSGQNTFHGKPVADNGKVVVSSVWPQAHITEWKRDPNSKLGRANPASPHIHTKGAVDVRPIPGLSFGQYVERFKIQGYPILQAIDESVHRPSWATGPNWHVVLGPRKNS